MIIRSLSAVAVGLFISACGSSTIPEGMRGFYQGQQSTGNRFAPVISLNGASPLSLEVFGEYVELGAQAQSIRDGVINPTQIQISSNLNRNILGQYNVVYQVTDSAGRFGSTTRIVNVVDTTRPVIAVAEPELQFERRNSNCAYSPSLDGVTATDNYDQTIQSKIQIFVPNPINLCVSNSYPIVYEVADQSGNAAVEKQRTIVVRDTIAPTASFNTPNPSIANAQDQISFGLTLSEVSADGALVAADFEFVGTSAGCSINSILNSATVNPSVQVQGCSENGSLQLRLKANSITDAAGNGNIAVTSSSVTIDNVAPVVQFLSGAPTPNLANGSDLIIFPLSVSGAGSNQSINQNEVDLITTSGVNCSKSISGGNTEFPMVTVSQCSGNGTVRVRIAEGAIRDGVNQSSEVTSNAATIDNIAPTASFNTPNPSIANAQDQISFGLTLSEASADGALVAADFEFVGTSAGCSISAVVNNAITATVQVQGCSGNGSLQLRLKANSITDAAGNGNIAVTSLSVTIDNIAPAFTFTPATFLVDLCSTSIAYQTEGISVQDANSLGTFELQSDPVNRNMAATYQVSFSSTDLAGNVGTAARTVIVNPLMRGEGEYQFSFDVGVSTPAEFLTRFNSSANNISNVILCNDIDFQGSAQPARGTLDGKFDGQGFELSNLSITSSSLPSLVGIFISISSTGLVRNLKLSKIQIMDNSFENLFGGTIAGYSEGKIIKVSVTESSVFSDQVAGGLVGYNSSNSLIDRSSAAVAVIVSDTSDGTYAGGLTGANDGVISNSYREADDDEVQSIVESQYRGGITGRLGASGLIENSYSNAAGICYDQNFAGGIVGFSSGGSVVNSYFNSDRSPGDCSDLDEFGVVALDDEAMKQPSSFADFDPLIWELVEGFYPRLQ